MKLPLFPLHMVLFPGASAPLQIFEPRYRVMIEQVLQGDRRLGIVAIRHGMEVGGPAETYTVGCLAGVEQAQRRDDDRITVVVRGIARFRIETRLPDDPYPLAEVQIVDEPIGLDGDRALAQARAAIQKYLSVVARTQSTVISAPSFSDDDPVAASFQIADAVHLDLPEQQGLLEARDAASRLRLAAELARREAMLLDMVGPSVGRPTDTISLN